MNHQPVTQLQIDQRVYDLYDEYCHGKIDRREYLKRASALALLGIPALATRTVKAGCRKCVAQRQRQASKW